MLLLNWVIWSRAIMEISLHTIVETITIMSFAGGVLNFAIIKPLKDAIKLLSNSIDKLEQNLTDMKVKEISLEQRVTHTEDSVKTAHRRIDDLEKYHKEPTNGKR